MRFLPRRIALARMKMARRMQGLRYRRYDRRGMARYRALRMRNWLPTAVSVPKILKVALLVTLAIAPFALYVMLIPSESVDPPATSGPVSQLGAGAPLLEFPFSTPSPTPTDPVVVPLVLPESTPTPTETSGSTRPAPRICSDGKDNDRDGRVDFPADPGCVSRTDNTEAPNPASPTPPPTQTAAPAAQTPPPPVVTTPPPPPAAPPPPPAPQCSNGIDDDGDGRRDFRSDRGCESPTDDSESPDPPLPVCFNGKDDDGDGATDMSDPGCSWAGDDTEAPNPACSNGVDDDGDGLIDTKDPGCMDPRDGSEDNPAPTPQCRDFLDNDRDGLVDGSDPGCKAADGSYDPSDTDEREPTPAPTPSPA